MEQKRRFLEAERRLGEVGLAAGITAGLGAGVNSVDRLVNWLAKYRDGDGPGRHPSAGDAGQYKGAAVPETGGLWGGD